MLFSCLFLFIIGKVIALPNQDGLSNELRFIHQEIGLLRDENQNQNKEIALLKEIMIKSLDEQQRSEDSNFEHVKKRPARLLPLQLLFNQKNNTLNFSDELLVTRRFYGPPHNCSELSKLGYTLNGFYQVKPLLTNSSSADHSIQLETVYCAFKQPGGGFDESKGEKRIFPEKLESIKTDLRDLQQLLLNLKSTTAMPDNPSVPKFYGPPHDCWELSKLGYTLNGFYQVKPLNSNGIIDTDDLYKLETVYCNFKQPGGVADESKMEKRLIAKKAKGIPTSCNDLKLLGYKLNGIYLIKTNKPNRGTKIEAVYCNFQLTTAVGDAQVFIGNVEVKTKSIHFYVQRDNSFRIPNAAITFNLARLNEGGAMNLGTGIFTAPLPGIYHFQFSARKDSKPDASIHLRLNDEHVGTACTNHNEGGWDSLSFSVSLRLKTNDQVSMYQHGRGTLYDNNSHYTHFSGWLVEEELI